MFNACRVLPGGQVTIRTDLDLAMGGYVDVKFEDGSVARGIVKAVTMGGEYVVSLMW